MVSIRPFGQCPRGTVDCITLSDHAGTQVEFLSYGAIVRSLIVPDRSGTPTDVVLGYDTVDDYRNNDTYLGICAGRFANRIAGSSITLNGEIFPLDANEGQNHLHGGEDGFHHHIWDYTTTENSVTFTRLSPHLEQGYPGNLKVSVTYNLSAPGRLDISYRAVSDADTVVSMTNHSYFNLSGHQSGSIADHLLALDCAAYTPCGAGNIPTGEIVDVEGTPFDLRSPTRLGDRLGDPVLAGTRGYDHNFVLPTQSSLPVARAISPASGICLEVHTDAPGLQCYTGGFISPRVAKDGVTYHSHQGLALEAQHFPDAMHHANFPSPILRAEEVYTQETSFVLTVQG